MQKKLDDLIERIDVSYRETMEVPPPPPSWLNAIATVAKIPSKGDPMVANMLGEINKSLAKHHKQTMEEYRKGCRIRQASLKKMMPHWRRLTRILEDVGKTITGLFGRSAVIDYRMQEYEEIFRGTERAERMLSSSSMTQFFISGFVLLIAIGGAIINFNLIALPMSEMVGGGSYIGPFQTANVAALVIILVEAAMGVYLMESLRITRLFPIIGAMDDKMRKRMVWITFSILFILAGIEAALAFMRDLIAADMQALRQSLAGTVAVSPANRWIPMVGQMVMGFILPRGYSP
jgi:cell wall assembly regulator SMI1